jgi:hypothetical protein
VIEALHDYAFADFPRVVLPAKINRRQFFHDLINDLRVRRASQEVNPTYKLADLGILPDVQLAKVIPILLPGVQIILRDGFLFGSAQEKDEPWKLFPEDTPAVRVLRYFDGLHSIASTASMLAAETGWEKSLAFAYTRGVFLWLVMLKLVVPKEKGG